MEITNITVSLLSQLRSVLQQLTDSEYAKPLPVLSGSSIGQHVRHILEFFDCLMAADAQKTVNYDSRKRDAQLETKVEGMALKISQIQDFLTETEGKGKLFVEACFLPDQEKPFRLPSSLERELAFNLEHTVHHMALIKIGFQKGFPKAEVPNNFGVAFSTINYQQEKDDE